MRTIILTLALLLACIGPAAAQNNISALHPELQQVYRQLTAGTSPEGRQVEITARLKAANEKAILLEDGYVDAGDGLRYAFLKFERGYTLTPGLERGQKVRLAFRILEGRNDATTPGMPYLLVELVRLEPAD